VVAGILNKVDNTKSIMVKVKDVNDAYRQQQQLKNELIQLNNVIAEKDNLLAEKQQTIDQLEKYHTS